MSSSSSSRSSSRSNSSSSSRRRRRSCSRSSSISSSGELNLTPCRVPSFLQVMLTSSMSTLDSIFTSAVSSSFYYLSRYIPVPACSSDPSFQHSVSSRVVPVEDAALLHVHTRLHSPAMPSYPVPSCLLETRRTPLGRFDGRRRLPRFAIGDADLLHVDSRLHLYLCCLFFFHILYQDIFLSPPAASKPSKHCIRFRFLFV